MPLTDTQLDVLKETLIEWSTEANNGGPKTYVDGNLREEEEKNRSQPFYSGMYNAYRSTLGLIVSFEKENQ